MKQNYFMKIALFALAGVCIVHALEAPEAFEEKTYKGVLFALNAAGSLVAALLLFKKPQDQTAWNFGLTMSVAPLMGYVLSRSVGLPGIPAEGESWLEPMGVASVLAEATFMAFWVLQRKENQVLGLKS